MSLTSSTQAAIALKNILGKSMTDTIKGVDNEAEGIFFNLDSSNIWVNDIPGTASIAVSQGVSIGVTASLTLDGTSNGRGYFASWPVAAPSGTDPITSLPYAYGSGVLSGITTGSRVRNGIPPSYGLTFEAKPYTGASLISPGDARNWIYQYNSGVFFQQDVTGGAPSSIALYVYVGDTLSDFTSTGLGSITGVTAGVGLSGGGTAGSISLAVNLGLNSGLTFSGDYVILDTNIAGNGLDFTTGVLSVNTSEITSGLAGNGLTANGSALDVSLGVNSGLTFSGDDIIVDTNIAGNGLDITAGVLSVNTSEITSTLAGDGLTDNGSALDVNVNSDSLEIIFDAIRLKDTITGDRTFQDSLTVNGNLTVNGTVSYINTENLFVEDNKITLNATYSGPYNAFDSGIEVNLGGGTYASLIWDSSESLWAVGLSGSESTIITESGTGLTKSGNTLSVDFGSITGTGLTQNGSQINVDFGSITGTGLTQNGTTISIDTTGFATALAGDGLSSNGGTLSVNVGNGLEIISDTVQLGGTLSQNTVINGSAFDLSIQDFDILSLTGSVVDVQLDNGFFLVDVGLAGSIDLYGGDVTIFATGSVDITTTNDFTLTTGTGSISTSNLEGLVYTDDYSGTFVSYSLVTKGFVDAGTSSIWQAIDSISGDFITGVTATNGLSGGGTSGFVTVEISDTVSGQGLTFSSGVIDMVWGGTSSGTTFSNDAVAVVVDGTTIQIDGLGQLTVVAGASKPQYDEFSAINTTGNDVLVSGVTLTSTPNDYSRIQVFVNGQLQRLGDNVTNKDCYFGIAPSSPIALDALSAGDQLYWNGTIAGFDLSSTDIVEIVYEY